MLQVLRAEYVPEPWQNGLVLVTPRIGHPACHVSSTRLTQQRLLTYLDLQG
jgi:hypothetical protein